MIDVIKFLQRLLNTGDLERLASKLGVSVPVGQLVKIVVMNLVPVGGETLYNYINKSIQDFKHKPAAEIWSDLKGSGGGFEWKEDFVINLFGHKIKFEKENQSEATIKTIAGVSLFAFLGFMFLRTR